MNSNINYMGMTLAAFTQAVARLLFSPMGASGKIRMVLPNNPVRVGVCSNLVRAFAVHQVAAGGDTAAQTAQRAWLGRVRTAMNNGSQLWGSAGVRMILQEGDWALGQQYMGVTIS